MQLSTTSRRLEHNVQNQLAKFTIKQSNKAFTILSKNLYQDPLLAIVRELYANAVDAHGRAGRADVPVEVTAPTRLLPTFIIKDYGTGLSHEQVMTLYCTYFDSDKDTTNDEIGGFGLGSKTPFVHADAFTVASRHEGMERTYSAFIDDAGVPNITLLTEKPTGELPGLTVTVPVKGSMVAEFRERIVMALAFFKAEPMLVNMDQNQLTPVRYDVEMPEYGFAIRRYHRHWGRWACVVMGEIPYFFDPAELTEELDEVKHIAKVRGLTLFAEIGDLEIQPSRERLSIDKATRTKLHAMLVRAELGLRETMARYVASGSTRLRKLLLQRKAQEEWDTTIELYSEKSFIFAAEDCSLAKVDHDSMKLTYISSWKPEKTLEMAPVLIWVDKPSLPYVQMLRLHKDTLFSNVWSSTEVLLLRGDEAAFKRAVNTICPTETHQLTTFTRPTAQDSKRVTGFVYTRRRGWYNNLSGWKKEALDLTQLGPNTAWVLSKGQKIEYGLTPTEAELLTYFGVMQDWLFIAVPRSKAKMVNSIKAPMLRDALRTTLTEWINTPSDARDKFLAKCLYSKMLSKMDQEILQVFDVRDSFYNSAEKWSKAYPQYDIGQLAAKFKDASQRPDAALRYLADLEEFIGFVSPEPDWSKFPIIAESKAVAKKYPLICAVADSWLTREPKKFDHYIKLVNGESA